MKKTITVLVVSMWMLVAHNGCNVSKDLAGAYNMANCQYSFNSISALEVGGIDFSKGFSVSQLPLITSVLSGKSSSIPVQFDLNINAKNTSESVAMLHGVQYIVNIDDIEFTSGKLNKTLNIAGGSSEMVPISIALDLASLMQTNSKESIVGIVKNLIGMGNTESKIMLQLKPTFMIGGVPVVSPTYFPVNFSFGGKK